MLSIDLAGRSNYASSGPDISRLLKLYLLQKMPRRLRDFTVELALRKTIKRHLVPKWRAMLSQVDCALLGGGELFQDGDLNFPLKLCAAAAECELRGVPLAIFAVGAWPSQSKRGRCLMRRLTTSDRVRFASARDVQSQQALLDLGLNATVCRDPALLAAGIWPKVQRAEHSRPLVGLGLAHPRLLAHHTPNVLRPRYDRSAAIYLGLIRGLCAAGCDVLCFTNGAGEDERWLAALRKQVPQPCRANVSFASRCASPKELAQLISRLDAIVAHRLHACILAFAYRVPAVGILWDPKLEAFFQSVQQDDYLIPFAEVSSRRIGPLIIEAIGKGIDPALHTRVVQEAKEAIEDLVQTLARETGAALRGPHIEHSFKRQQPPSAPMSPHATDTGSA